MYAIVDISGKQFKLFSGKYIYAPKIEAKEGNTITLDKTLLVGRDDDTIVVGNPLVRGATVSCTVLEHKKSDKITVFKKKRRKGYKVRRGHRQEYTKLRIESINHT